jgi:hypothetical protein
LRKIPAWSRHFDTAPLGYLLRKAHPDRWLRVHSLPESKRYSTGPEEQEIVLHRQATLAAELLTTDPVQLITVQWAAVPDESSQAKQIAHFGDRTFHALGHLGRAIDPVDGGPSFWASDGTWENALERQALLAIANDEIRALWLNTRSGEVFAPYDGGVDLILQCRERRDALRLKYVEWLSGRSDGL